MENKAVTSTDSDVTSDFTIPGSTSVSSWGSSNTQQLAYYANNTTNGAYYSWCTATAGTCPSGSGEAANSICPKGWRLPSKAEYDSLLSKAGIESSSAGYARIANSPYGFVLAGQISGSKLNASGSQGWYWSKTAGDGSNAYYLYLTSSSVKTSSHYRNFGISVRCIAKQAGE